MSIITSVMRHAYGSLHSIQSANLIRRGFVLFTVGVFLALVLNLLQIQRNVTLFPEEVIATLFSSAWWIPPSCGTAAGKGIVDYHSFKLIVGYFITLHFNDHNLWNNKSTRMRQRMFVVTAKGMGGGVARRCLLRSQAAIVDASYHTNFRTLCSVISLLIIYLDELVCGPFVVVQLRNAFESPVERGVLFCLTR